MLWVHFFIGHSYNMLRLVGAAIAKVTNKALWLDSMPNLRIYRNALPVGKIKFFENPEEQSFGRIWPHNDMLPHVFENEAIVRAHNFYLGQSEDPFVAISSHYNGATQTSFLHVTTGVTRLIALGDLSRNPACLLTHFIDEAAESTAQMLKYFRVGIFSDLLLVDKIPVACFDIEQCQMCEHGYPRELPFKKWPVSTL